MKDKVKKGVMGEVDLYDGYRFSVMEKDGDWGKVGVYWKGDGGGDEEGGEGGYGGCCGGRIRVMGGVGVWGVDGCGDVGWECGGGKDGGFLCDGGGDRGWGGGIVCLGDEGGYGGE